MLPRFRAVVNLIRGEKDKMRALLAESACEFKRSFDVDEPRADGIGLAFLNRRDRGTQVAHLDAFGESPGGRGFAQIKWEKLGPAAPRGADRLQPVAQGLTDLSIGSDD